LSKYIKNLKQAKTRKKGLSIIFKNRKVLTYLPSDDEGFFDTNKFATIYSKDESYTLDFFAYMIVNSDDKIIFDINADPVRFYILC